MNTLRYNSFNQIHKGLRAQLYDTALRLQQTDMSDAKAAASVIEQVEEVLYLFESHAHGEDHYFNEPLEKTNPEIATLFVAEHVEDHRLAKMLSDLITSYREASTFQVRAEISKRLFYAFNEFIAFNLYHMNKEEIELNAALWEHYSDAEIKSIEQTLVESIPPQKMMKSAKWMIRGINNIELIHWLEEVRRFAPPPVFEMLISIAETELPVERFELITKALKNELTATTSTMV
jgi:hypothetical protein